MSAVAVTAYDVSAAGKRDCAASSVINAACFRYGRASLLTRPDDPPSAGVGPKVGELVGHEIDERAGYPFTPLRGAVQRAHGCFDG